jgi:hypothetical protein
MKISNSSIIASVDQVEDDSPARIAFEHIMNGQSGRGIFVVSNYEFFEVHNLKATVPYLGTKKTRLFDVNSYKGIIENAEIECSVVYTSGIAMNQCSVKKSIIDVDSISNSMISQSDITCLYNPIDRCDFVDMRGNVIRVKGITNCTFNNIVCRTENFIKTTASVSNCIFFNIDLGNGKYLIDGVVDYGIGEKKQDVVVSNCRFMNCYTDRADRNIITGNQTHHKFFSDKTVPYTVVCKNCIGLDQVKKGKFEKIEEKQQECSVTKGVQIGVEIDFGAKLNTKNIGAQSSNQCY